MTAQKETIIVEYEKDAATGTYTLTSPNLTDVYNMHANTPAKRAGIVTQVNTLDEAPKKATDALNLVLAKISKTTADFDVKIQAKPLAP